MQFLQTQASAQATRPSITKSEKTLQTLKFFLERGPSTKIIHERLESFEIALDLKMTLNLDRMPTPEASIAYTFSHSRTSRTAQGYIAPKIQAKLYQDWTDVLQDFKNAFSGPDPEFHAQCKLIRLRQANKTFVEFFTRFSKYAGR